MKYFFLFLGIMMAMVTGRQKAIAQYDNIWIWGDGSGIDFSTDPPSHLQTSLRTSEGTATMCDAGGTLLFYTDGYTVWDRNHNIMPLGSNLPGRRNPIYTMSTTQAAVIMPAPGSGERYYIFSLGSTEFGGNLYYSVVDMSLNNGLGDIVPDQKSRLLALNNTEQMMAVSGDNCDAWLLTATLSPSVFKVYHIDRNGVDTIPVLSDRHPGEGEFGGKLGTIDIAPDRSMLSIAQGNLVLYDFDRNSGRLKYRVTLLKDVGYCYTAVFSPDNTKLYAGGLEQFDLNLPDTNRIIASKTVLGRNGGMAKRGPDGKIYAWSAMDKKLSIIHKPNLVGKDCLYDSTGLALAPGASTYYTLPNSALIIVPPLYSSVIRDTFSCQDNFSLEPLRRNGFNYRWNDDDTGTKRVLDKGGTYWVSYQVASGKCETFADTFHIVFYPNKRIFSTRLYDGICAADTFEMRAGAAATQYTWNDGGTGRSRRVNHSGTYWVSYAIDSLCIWYVDTFVARYPTEPYRVSFAADTLICENDLLDFKNTSDGRFDRFLWLFGTGDTAAGRHAVYAYTGAGQYQVMLIGRIKDICRDTFVREITVDSVYPLRFHASRSHICSGESVTFYPDAGPFVKELAWRSGDKVGLSTVDSVLWEHAFSGAGVFPVVLTARNRACPVSFFSDTVTVYPLPQIYLGADSSLCPGMQPLLLQNRFPEPEGTWSRLWNTGDTTAMLAVQHPGKYSLTLKHEGEGCSGTATIALSADCYIDIPNAFSPNGDGVNDYFFPRQLLSGGAVHIKFQIFNRWGQKLFESDGVHGRGWDGQYGSQAQPEGVYIYQAAILLNNGRQEQYRGNVSLLR